MNYKYFDNASTTKPSDNVIKCYNNYLEDYFNPSSLYLPSNQVKKNIEQSRLKILKLLNAQPKSYFIFTSSATESNNTALKNGIRRKDKKAIITMGEHSSVYNHAVALKNEGYDIEFANLCGDGTVNIEHLLSLIDEKTTFVSIIHVNNETGAINDIEKIAKVIKQKNRNIIIHVDGVQAVGKVKIDLSKLDIDFYTISAHKINGVRGVAGLYVRYPEKFIPYLIGGGQENAFRGGTENYAAIMSFDTALSEAILHLNNHFEEYKNLFLNNLVKDNLLIVSNKNCVNNIICICYKNVRAETLQYMMQDKGFLIGIGSACNSRHKDNRVLENMNIHKEYIEGSIRISFGEDITKNDIIDLAKALNNCTKEYREKVSK